MHTGTPPAYLRGSAVLVSQSSDRLGEADDDASLAQATGRVAVKRHDYPALALRGGQLARAVKKS